MSTFRVYQSHQPETWEKHLQDFQFWIDAKGTLSDAQKRGLLMETLDDETKERLKEWVAPRTLRDCTFDQLLIKLDEKIVPSINHLVRYAQFHSRYQKEGEPVADYLKDLRRLASSCKFADAANPVILAQFVLGLRDRAIQAQLSNLYLTLTISQALELAQGHEQAKVNVRMIRGEDEYKEEVHKIAERPRPSEKPKQISCFKCHEPGHYAKDCRQGICKPQGLKLICYRCGDKTHFAKECPKPWSTFKCDVCGKRGHLAKICKLTLAVAAAQSAGNPVPSSSRTPTAVTHHVEQEYSDTLYNVTSDQSHDGVVLKPLTVALSINGISVTFEVDSGASRSVISLATFPKLFPQHKPELYNSNITLTTWGQLSVLNVNGRFMASVKFNNQLCCLPLLVSEADGPNLLGRDWFTPLSISISYIHHMQPSEPTSTSIFQYPAVTGIGTGCFRGPPIHIDLDKQVKPVYQRARPVPFAFTTLVDQAIQKNIDKGIWIPITFTPAWATALVIVKKKQGTVRLCGDNRGTINKALTADLYQTLSVDAVLARLGTGNTIFAEVDLEEAYTQLSVDHESSLALTVNTTKGLFRVARLPFEIKMASAAFQRVVDGIVGGLPGVFSYQDNIFVAAPDEQVLNDRLRMLLHALSDSGLRVNKEKCTWKSQSLEVLGFLVDKDGVRPLPSRITAIKEAPAPTSVKELQHLLSLISYYGRFFKDKATILEPLHRLLDTNSKWAWTEAHQCALDTIKAKLTNEQVLVHYSLKLPLLLYVDASPYGVGAILCHQVVEGNSSLERPVMYASRTLAPHERRYSQLDREALGVIFGIKNFKTYLVGRVFTIVTDHKPLLGLFNPQSPIPEHASPRMLRWCLELASMDYRIMYKPGTAIAHVDFLSRMPLNCQSVSEEVLPSEIHLLQAKDLGPLTSKHIAAATLADQLLSRVLHWIMEGWPDSIPDDAQVFFKKRNEISVVSDCLVWHNRYIIPPALRVQALQLIHATHLGETYSKSVARSVAWWPNIDLDIVSTVKTCELCQLAARSPPKPVISPWPASTSPWERVHLDYAGPVNGQYFLIAIDSFSSWPVVKVVSSFNSATLITHMRYIFAEYGKPYVIVSDNGRSFTSMDFRQFLAQNGIKQLFTPPWHPASNVLAERTVYSFKQFLSKFQVGDIHTRVARILYAMRTAPVGRNGLTPAELMGRPFRTHLSSLHPNSVPHLQVEKNPKLPLYHPGELVWVLKHGINTARWIAGVIIANLGQRDYDVRLSAGTTMSNVSADHIRKRFAEEAQIPDDVDATAIPDPITIYPTHCPGPAVPGRQDEETVIQTAPQSPDQLQMNFGHHSPLQSADPVPGSSDGPAGHTPDGQYSVPSRITFTPPDPPLGNQQDLVNIQSSSFNSRTAGTNSPGSPQINSAAPSGGPDIPVVGGPHVQGPFYGFPDAQGYSENVVTIPPAPGSQVGPGPTITPRTSTSRYGRTSRPPRRLQF